MRCTKMESTRSGRTPAVLCALLVGTLVLGAAPAAWAQSADGPWFGVTLPPGFAPHALQVISERPAAPAVVPSGESGYQELRGSSIQADLERIVDFAKESRTTREVGDAQLWGRITGFPSGMNTVAWAADQFRAAGVADVELQTFDQDAGASIWLPLSWEVRLLGDPAFGAGSGSIGRAQWSFHSPSCFTAMFM